MFRCREGTRLDLGSIRGKGVAHCRGKRGVWFDKFRCTFGQAEHVVHHQHLPVALRPRAYTDDRHRNCCGDSGTDIGRCALQHDGNAPASANA